MRTATRNLNRSRARRAPEDILDRPVTRFFSTAEPKSPRHRIRAWASGMRRKIPSQQGHDSPLELRSILFNLRSELRSQSPGEIFNCSFQAQHRTSTVTQTVTKNRPAITELALLTCPESSERFVFRNLRNRWKMHELLGESGLQARWSVLVPCTCRVPHLGVFVVFLRSIFSWNE